jgi:hypothetical protein
MEWSQYEKGHMFLRDSLLLGFLPLPFSGAHAAEKKAIKLAYCALFPLRVARSE